MKPDERDAAYLWDMLRWARAAHGLLVGKSLDAYLKDQVLRLALERALELVGEAARHVTEKFQSEHGQVEWRNIVGQRNILAHQYGAIDHERLYRTGKESIPLLIASLEEILDRLPGGKT